MSSGRKDKAIVISDSDSDTLSESERPSAVPQSKKSVEVAPAREKADVTGQQQPMPSTSNAVQPSAAAQSALSSLIPDRAQLERERRERARKRRRDQGIQSSSSDEDEQQPQPKRTKDVGPHAREAATGPSQALPNASNSSRWEGAATPVSSTSRYWHGTIKHGFNKYAAASSRGSSIASMLLPATGSSRNGLQLAVLATYDLRMDWLYSQFPRGVPVTLVVPPGDGDYRTDPSIPRPGLHPTEIFAEYSRCPGWNLCVPHKPKGGWMTQHMKFLFLVHESFLRIAILSGNLNDIDWDRIENTAYIQDFPLLTAAESAGPVNGQEATTTPNDTKSQVLQVLRSLSVPRQHTIYAALDTFDFSATPRANIMASWPEARVLTGWSQIETQGLGRMGHLARSYGLPSSKEGVTLECQGSSLSTYDRKWLEHFHVLASAKSPRNALPFKGKADETHSAYHTLMGTRLGSLPPVKVCFPSQKYVEEVTVEGPLGAASFFGKANDYKASPIKNLFHTPKSRRGDVMIHAKSILALTKDGNEIVDRAFAQTESASTLMAMRPAWKPVAGEKPVGWSYLGSSNFTRAAHGNISGTSASPTMSSRNWELGVMMPIYASEVEAFGIEAECLRPIVYRRPLTAYTSSDTPWDQQSLRL